MSERVKPKITRPSTRQYDSSRRQELARQNRAAVLDAARVRFLRDGYAPTTLNDIAADAGVSVQTVYKTFADKGGVLKAVFDVTLAGDDEPIPIAEREIIQRVIREPDPAQKIAIYIGHRREGHAAYRADPAPRARRGGFRCRRGRGVGGDARRAARRDDPVRRQPGPDRSAASQSGRGARRAVDVPRARALRALGGGASLVGRPGTAGSWPPRLSRR